jgi:hypothetical protein
LLIERTFSLSLFHANQLFRLIVIHNMNDMGLRTAWLREQTGLPQGSVGSRRKVRCWQ